MKAERVYVMQNLLTFTGFFIYSLITLINLGIAWFCSGSQWIQSLSQEPMRWESAQDRTCSPSQELYHEHSYTQMAMLPNMALYCTSSWLIVFLSNTFCTSSQEKWLKSWSIHFFTSADGNMVNYSQILWNSFLFAISLEYNNVTSGGRSKTTSHISSCD